MKTLRIFLLGIAIFLFGEINYSSAQFVVRVRPVAPVAVGIRVAAPGPNYVWIDGGWRWHRNQYVWREGYWARPRRGRVWVPGFWRDAPGGVVWVDGRWRRR